MKIIYSTPVMILLSITLTFTFVIINHVHTNSRSEIFDAADCSVQDTTVMINVMHGYLNNN